MVLETQKFAQSMFALVSCVCAAIVLFARKSDLVDPTDALPNSLVRAGVGVGFAVWWSCMLMHCGHELYAYHFPEDSNAFFYFGDPKTTLEGSMVSFWVMAVFSWFHPNFTSK